MLFCFSLIRRSLSIVTTWSWQYKYECKLDSCHLISVERQLPMAYCNSIEERIFILEKSFQGDAPPVQTEFAERFPGRVPPSRQAIHTLKKKFRETGSAMKSGRSVSVRSPQNREAVAQFYHENPSTSQVRASIQVQISQTSLQRTSLQKMDDK